MYGKLTTEICELSLLILIVCRIGCKFPGLIKFKIPLEKVELDNECHKALKNFLRDLKLIL